MARTDTLELLSSVVERLGPIAAMTPGSPLRAGDWNHVVEAIRDLARMVASRERTTDEFLAEDYARVDHTHVSQVGLTWFDPPTRALVEQGLQGAVDQKASIQSARDELQRMAQALEAQQKALDDARAQLDGLRDNDAARERGVSRVELRVEALRTVETSVATFNGRLGTLQTDMSAALAFRDQLVSTAGAPIDVRGLNDRVGSLETLRDNLRTADGNVVRIRDLESALARLEQNGLGRADLDSALITRLRDSNLLAQAGLVDAVLPAVTNSLSGRFTALEAGTARLGTDLTSARAQLTAHEGTLGQFAGRLAGAENQVGALAGLGAQVGENQTRLTAVEAGVQANLAAVADLPGLRTRVQQVEGQVGTLSGLGTRVTQIEGRVSASETRLDSIDAVIPRVDQLGQRLGGLEQALPALQESASRADGLVGQLAQLGTRVAASESELDNITGLTGRLDSLTSNLDELRVWQRQADDRLRDLTSRTSLVTELGPRLATLEQNAAEMRNSLTQLGNNVRISNGNLDALRSSLETLSVASNDVATLRTNLTRMESRIGQLERPVRPIPGRRRPRVDDPLPPA